MSTNIRNVSNHHERIQTNAPEENSVLSLVEAKEIIQSLKSFQVKDVGSKEFLQMYGCSLVRLALQAHETASFQNEDEFIIELILMYEKLEVLIRMLLILEIWREYILKNKQNDESIDDIPSHISRDRGNILKCAFTLHVETTIVSLLSLILYHKKSIQELSEDVLIELIDYCARNMIQLATPLDKNIVLKRQKEPLDANELSRYMHTRTSIEEIKDSILDTEFQTYVGSIAIARFLCEHMESFSLGAQNRILETHDFLPLTIPLIHNPPWTRRRQMNQEIIWEKYIQSTWKQIPKTDLLQVTQLEAQTWIILFHLTTSCREKYPLTTFRKDTLLSIRKFLNEFLVDQLPFLEEVVRYLDELAIMSVPDSSGGDCFLMQQVPVLRDGYMKSVDWEDVRRYQMAHVFPVQDGDGKKVMEDDVLRQLSDIYTMDGIEHILTDNPYPSSSSNIEDNSIQLKINPTSVSINITKRNNTAKTILNQVQFDIDYKSAKQVDDAKTKESTIQYQRMKMNVMNESNSKMNSKLVPSNCALEVYIKAEECIETLFLENVDLPAQSGNDCKVPDTMPATIWKQIGTRNKNKFVIQLGFKRVDDGVLYGDEILCYRLQSAFISMPF